jgi:cell wall-associated NlpC family hydrolase
VLLVGLGSATHAYAQPSPAELEAQIDTEWNKLEPLIEQHNQVTAQLNDNKAKAAKLADQIRPLQLQVDLAMRQVSAISAEAYKGGRASKLNALLSGGSPASLADQLSMLDALAKDQQNRVADVAALKARYDAEKKPLDDVVAKLGAQQALLAEQEKTINAGIANLNGMRLQAYGSTGGLGSLRPTTCPVAYDGSRGSKVAQLACQQISKPYVFGTDGPRTFDCSGLTEYVWRNAGGVSLDHSSSWQYQKTKHVTRAMLRPGDLIYMYSDFHHVGLYVGGEWMVVAPRSGDVVRMQPLDYGRIVGYSRPGG